MTKWKQSRAAVNRSRFTRPTGKRCAITCSGLGTGDWRWIWREQHEVSHSKFAVMKIATFNINNIKRRLANLLAWLGEAEPDIVCLQELKATDGAFPSAAIHSAGYEAVWRGSPPTTASRSSLNAARRFSPDATFPATLVTPKAATSKLQSVASLLHVSIYPTAIRNRARSSIISWHGSIGLSRMPASCLPRVFRWS